MSDAIQRGGRRFGDKEVGAILKRAAELQESQPVVTGEGPGLSLAELESIAQEAGIDGTYVRRALQDLDAVEAPGTASAFLGSPTFLEFERTVEGEVSSETFMQMVHEIQSGVGEIGAPSTVGSAFSWHSANMQRPLLVSITPRGGRTKIRIEERLTQIAGGLFGGLMGGLGGGGMGVAFGVGIGALGLPIVAVAAAVGFVGGSYVLSRGIFRSVVRQRSKQLRRLMDRLEELAVEGGP